MMKCPCCEMGYWNGIVPKEFTIYGLTLPEMLELLDLARMKGYKQNISSICPLN